MQDPRSAGRREIAASCDIGKCRVLSKVGVVRDGLFSRQVSEIVSAGVLKGSTLSIELILEDDPWSIRCVHEDLDDTILEIREACRSIDFATNIEENRPTWL
jgi:hypothetical protein